MLDPPLPKRLDPAAERRPAYPWSVGPAEPICPPGPVPANGDPASGCPKNPIGRRSLVLPKHDGLPIILPGGRVEVPLAQEADVVGLYQRVDVGRIGVEFAVVQLDRPDVLLAAMHGLNIPVALNIFTHLGQRDRKGKDQQKQQENHRNQHVPLFRRGPPAVCASLFIHLVMPIPDSLTTDQ